MSAPGAVFKRTCAALLAAGVASVCAAAPAGAAAAQWKWTVSHAPAADGLIGVACPSAKLCVSLTNAGKVLVTSHPAAGAKSWSAVAGLTVLQTGGTLAQQNAAAQIDLEAYDLSCPSAHLCVIGQPGLSSLPKASPPLDPVGSVVWATNPLGGASAWHSVKGIGDNFGEIASLACVSAHLCYAFSDGTDQFGNGLAQPLVSTDPTGGGSAWRVTGAKLKNDSINGLACQSTKLCVAAGGEGLYWSTRPAAAQASWRYVRSTNNDGQIDAVSCPSTGFCIAQPDEAGCKPCGAPNDLVSTDPLAGVWRDGPVATGKISCHGITLCVGPGGGSAKPQPIITYSTSPATRAWEYVDGLGRRLTLRAVSCATSHFCVAVGDAGAIVVGQRS